LATVLYAMRKLPSVLGKRVVVIGQGPIGLYFNALLSGGGARQVIGIERVANRLEAGLAMGATHVIDATEGRVVQEVEALTEGRFADIVVEAVGHQSETVDLAIELARREGDILLFGVPYDGTYPFP